MDVSDRTIFKSRSKEINKIMYALGTGKIVVLYGDAGVGKTFLAEFFLRYYGFTMVKLNGHAGISPERIPTVREGLAGERIGLLIDEMDRGSEENFTTIRRTLFDIHKTNRGKITCVETRVPTIATCNEENKIKLDDLYIEKINIKPLSREKIENIIGDSSRSSEMAENCQGDIRSALNNLEIGEIEKSERISQTSFIRSFLRKDPSDAERYLAKYKIGEYGGLMQIAWLVSVLSRNIDGDKKEKRAKMDLLSFVSANKYIVNIEMTRNLLASLCPIYLERVNFPNANKKKAEYKRGYRESGEKTEGF